MKTISTRTLAITAIAVTLLAIAGTNPVSADYYGPHHPYTYGHNGYWDQHRGYHHWNRYNGYDGYYHRRSDGVRVFIRL